MIQSVVRASNILEVIHDLDKGEGVGLVEIARQAGLEKPTVYNLVKTLLSLNYVRQDKVGGKYRLGTKLLELTSGILGDEQLEELCRPLSVELSQEINENVLLVAYRAGNLKIICRLLCDNELIVAPNNFKPLYTTVTGRLILAQLPEPELQRAVELLGMPEELWDGIDNFSDLSEKLHKIRHNGHLLFQSDKRRLGGIGYIVPVAEKYAPLAIGSVMPLFRFREKKKQLCKLFAEYTKKLTVRLNNCHL